MRAPLVAAASVWIVLVVLFYDELSAFFHAENEEEASTGYFSGVREARWATRGTGSVPAVQRQEHHTGELQLRGHTRIKSAGAHAKAIPIINTSTTTNISYPRDE